MGTGGRWDGVSVLLTGAQGFVGAWLAERLLAEGARVVVPRRDTPADSRFRSDGIEERCDLAAVDITDCTALTGVLHEHAVRAVFHLAAQSAVQVAGRSPYSTWESNVRGSYTVLEACRAAREAGEAIERVVVSSSVLAYGTGTAEPWREDSPLEPFAPYAVSKAATDLIARSYARSFDLPVAVSRMASVYGGGDMSFSRLVPGACRSLVHGERPVLRSDGKPVRELLYVEDAVEALLAIAGSLDRDALRGRAWNAGGGGAVPVLDVVSRLVEASGRDLPPDVQGAPGGPERQEVDSYAIRSELGWQPEWDLDDGLRATYAWYEERLSER